MSRPRVTLHIFTSIDGKITGEYSKTKECEKSIDVFKAIGFEETRKDSYHFQGWIYGSGTALEFTNHKVPELKETFKDVPSGDYITNLNKEKYFISFDRTGKIGWESNKTSYAEQEAHVIEVLTQKVSNQYKAFLRSKEIPYIICGEEEIDIPLTLNKLHDIYGLTNLLLGGGGILNWSFLDAGLVDEISLIIAPAVDGNIQDTNLFNSSFSNNSYPIGFKLKSVDILEGSTLWVKYEISNEE